MRNPRRQKLRKNCDLEVSRATFTHEIRWTSKTASLRCRPPLRTKRTLEVKNCGKIATLLVNRNPYARNGRGTSKIEEELRLYLSIATLLYERWTSKSEEKLRWTLSFSHRCLCAQRRLCVKASVCKSVCV